MRPHLQYLKYVLLHKLYVFAAGVAVARIHNHLGIFGWIGWLWRLIRHDWSKFLPSEWTPYVENFYGVRAEEWMAQRQSEFARYHPDDPTRARTLAESRWGEEKKRRQAAFNYAWLLHQHRNPHHWQHWLLNEDSGKRLVLLPPAHLADEMVADWLGAGNKVLRFPSLAECVGETIVWYMQNRQVIVLREQVRQRIEVTLHSLAANYGLVDLAYQVQMQAMERVTVAMGVPKPPTVSRR